MALELEWEALREGLARLSQESSPKDAAEHRRLRLAIVQRWSMANDVDQGVVVSPNGAVYQTAEGPIELDKASLDQLRKIYSEVKSQTYGAMYGSGPTKMKDALSGTDTGPNSTAVSYQLPPKQTMTEHLKDLVKRAKGNRDWPWQK